MGMTAAKIYRRMASDSRNNTFMPLRTSRQKELCNKLGLVRVRDYPSFPSLYMRYPCTTYHVQGDGNCYFRSVSYVLTGSEDQYSSIRRLIVAHMMLPKVSQKLRNILGEPVNQYLERSNMQEDGVWATEAEIIATASLTGHDVVVYTQHGFDRRGRPNHQWLRYTNSFNNNRRSKEAIYLKNVGEHFDVVRAAR